MESLGMKHWYGASHVIRTMYIATYVPIWSYHGLCWSHKQVMLSSFTCLDKYNHGNIVLNLSECSVKVSDYNPCHINHSNKEVVNRGLARNGREGKRYPTPSSVFENEKSAGHR